MAMKSGHEISCLVNFISQEYKRVSFHGTEAALIKLQAESIGLPLFQEETTPDAYEKEFKGVVKGLIPGGIEGMIFGDIYLDEHKAWVERVCGDLGIKAIEPLWNKKTEDIFLELIDSGFEALVVSAKKDLFTKDWIGKRLDRKFLKYLKENNIDICGENGEYHTLVVDGPIFKEKIKIDHGKVVERGSHLFLDTVEYSLYSSVPR